MRTSYTCEKTIPDWWLGSHGKYHNASHPSGTMEYGSITPLGTLEHLEFFEKL